MSKEEDSTLLSKLLNFNPFKSKNDSLHSQQYEKQQPSNTINELQILIAHTDIVRIVQKIDETRIASASDDATINIWNYVTGEKLLTLVGHKKPITCLLLLDRNVLVSGSSDRTMRMWDLAKGQCTRIMTAHQGSIKAFCMLPRGMFCSGANDRQLCIWSLDGELISTIERQEEEILHCLICVSNEWVVTASNSQFLLAYHIDGQQPFKLLAYHRESVQCLVRISDKFFASASLDGCLVVWNTDSLSPGRVLAYPENYKSSEKIFIYSVHFLLPLGEGYLVVAIGKKVELYDVVTGECILECENTHESNITCMISLYGGTRLLTSSADSSIKIWELPNLGQLNSTSSNVIMSPKRQRKKKANHPIKAVCAGDMWGHSDGVYCMTSLTDNSLASCGGDGCVVLWKDGQVQSDMRNGFAAVSLLHHTVDDCEEYEHEFFPFTEFSDGSYDGSMDPNRLDPLGQVFYEDCEIDTQSPPSLYLPISSISTTPSSSSHLYPMLTAPATGQTTTATGSTPTNTSSLLMTSSTSPATRSSPLSGSPSNSFPGNNKRSGSITVPEYIFSYSQGLRKEKKLSLDEIAGHLRDQGHSENLIAIVSQRLLETS